MTQDREILVKAMFHAFNEFQNYIEGLGYDPSFFSLYMDGYVLTDNFEKLEEICMNLNRTGTDKFNHPDNETI